MITPEEEHVRQPSFSLNDYFRNAPDKQRIIIVPIQSGIVTLCRPTVTDHEEPVDVIYTPTDGTSTWLGVLSLLDATTRADGYKLPSTNLVATDGTPWNLNIITEGFRRDTPFDLLGGHLVPTGDIIFTDK